MDDFKDTDDRSLADLLAALRRETLDRSDPGRVIQDLQVHRLELEIQNREPAERHDLRLVIRREGANPIGEPATAARVILLDITEIKRAQAAIHTQQRFLQQVVDGIADPLRVTGMDHQVLLTNAAARVARVDGIDWPSVASADDGCEAMPRRR